VTARVSPGPVGAGASPGAGPSARRSVAIVIDNTPLGSLTWLTVHSPGWPGASPGRFVMLQRVDSGCFLGRPLSIAQQDGENVSFLIAAVGEGSRELCALRPGDVLWVTGPLGNGFDIEALSAGSGRLVIVGGGVGVAPFPLLLSALAARAAEASAPAEAGEIGGPVPCEVLVLLGFRDGTQASGASPIAEAAGLLEAAGVPCPGELVTEDGSIGRPERVTETLWRHLRPGDKLAVCGPWPMTEGVAKVCAALPGVAVWYSLESGMACGVGSCHGCVVPLADGSLSRVCREGPVFTSEELFARGCFTGEAQGGEA
jgi:dihydroorotate dehydrogenase electron transfer subunit